MSFNGLPREAKRVQAVLKELDDKRIICTKPVSIYVPARFVERELAVIGSSPQILGIYAMVLEGECYAVSLVNAMMSIEPTTTLRVIIDDTEYYQFGFEAGSTVFASSEVIRQDGLVYEIYNEIIAGGHVPPYVTYLDLCHIFDTAKSHANANIGENREVTELIVSMIARNEKNRVEYYRQSVTSLRDIEMAPPAFISLRSVQYSATNTTNKLVGSYMEQGLVAALVSPAVRTERVEALLRA